jgi:ribose transport system permease protein
MTVDDLAAPTSATVSVRPLRDVLGAIGRIAPLVLVAVVFSVLRPDQFAQADNVTVILSQTAVAALLACGLSISLTAGVFDLSFGAVLALVGVILAKILNAGVPWPLAVPAAILAASLIGVLSGAVIVRTRVPSLVVTLGAQSILLGAVTWLSAGGYITIDRSAFVDIGRGEAILGIPNETTIMLVVCGLGALATRYLVTGRNLQSVGANPEASRLAGIRVDLYVAGALVATAAFAGLAACLVTAELGAGHPEIGPGYLLPAFAAAFIGAGVSRSGSYTFVGAAYGALLLTTLNNGLVILDAPDWTQSVVTGTVLIAAVAVSRAIRRRALSA